MAALVLLFVAAAPSQARYSAKKAIWGPAYVNGVSQFEVIPTYTRPWASVGLDHA